MENMPNRDAIAEAVQHHYGCFALGLLDLARDHANLTLPMVQQPAAACCGPETPASTDVAAALYGVDETSELPPAAVLASRGCGNPLAVAELLPGEVVLDLGSGGGIDVLLSARRVGEAGFAYGLDANGAMLELAWRNAHEAGVENVSFLKGDIEAIPLPDASVDVVISNCVINLAADKAKVLAEAHRVLKPGGRFAVADVVVQGRLAADAGERLDLWASCYAGALEEASYLGLLTDAGFTEAEVEPLRGLDDPAGKDGGTSLLAEGRFVSAFVRARKR